MNRIQKKCFIGSAGVHLLLLLILLFGPAFLSSRDKTQDTEILDFIPATTIDGNAFNPGAAPTAQKAPPAQQQTAQAAPPAPVVPPTPPKPEPERISEPEPPKAVVRNPEALEPPKTPKKTKIEVSTKLVTRNSNETRRNAEKEAAQAAAAQQQRLARLFGTAAKSLKSGLSGSTEVKFSDGIGGGSGPAYGNWLSAVQTVYYSNWDVPGGASEDLETTASVTIARDGTILTSHITRRSGNSAMDKSVQETLDRVRSVSPFPATSKDEQRELNIVFKPIKQLLG